MTIKYELSRNFYFLMSFFFQFTVTKLDFYVILYFNLLWRLDYDYLFPN